MPSTFTTQMFQAPVARVLENAMRRPSGDQAGSMSPGPADVTGVWSLPSAFITQIWKGPLPRSYAMRVPSGDQTGCCSTTSVQLRRLTSLPSAAAE